MSRTRVKKVVFGIAVAAFLAAAATLGTAVWAVSALGGAHVVTASLFASVFFFACCGIVLYFMSVMPRALPPDQEGGG